MPTSDPKLPCLWCDEPIAPGERWVDLPFVEEGGAWSYRKQHQECMMRSILGSPAHIERRCSCFRGPDCGDPREPGLTKREEARQVYTLWESGKAGPIGPADGLEKH